MAAIVPKKAHASMPATWWGPTAVIVLGYLAGGYRNVKRVDDFKLWMSAELKGLEGGLNRVEATFTSELRRVEEKHDNAIQRLEDRIGGIRSPVAR